MQESLAVGDEVVTAGGIFGTLTQVHDETVVLTVAPGVELTMARPAIHRRLVTEDSSQEDRTMTDNDSLSDGTEA